MKLVAAILTLASFAVAAQTQPLRSTGLQFLDDSAYRSIPLAVTPAMGVLPASVDHAENFPPPGNQGAQGSCVGWAVSYLKAYQEKVERGWKPWTGERIFSPSYIYNQLNVSGNCSAGAYIPDALNLVRREGIATISMFGYFPGQCHVRPDMNTKNSARQFAISDWRRANVQDEIEIKSHVASGFPVLIGAVVDDAFMRLGLDVYRNRGGAERGGHAMVVIGYDDSRSAFRLINSWGTSWGSAGYGWISYKMFRSIVREAYVVQDIVPTRPSQDVSIVDPIPKQLVLIPAKNYVRGTNVAIGQCGPYGADVLLNASPCNSRPNVAEFDFVATRGGAYRLDVEYATAVPRPVRVYINGGIAMQVAVGEATGCFTENCQKNLPQGIVQLKEGPNVIRLEREDVFPHIRRISFVPAD